MNPEVQLSEMNIVIASIQTAMQRLMAIDRGKAAELYYQELCEIDDQLCYIVNALEDEDKQDRVTVDPNIRFGRPSVRGISVDAIVEQSKSGASEDEIARDYGISVTGVRAALAYVENEVIAAWAREHEKEDTEK